MNDRQNTVVATTIVGIILVIVFLCPWRVQPSGELRWSPIYQPPLTYVRSYDTDLGRQGSARIEPEDAERSVGVLVLEVLAVAATGGVLYAVTADREGRDETTPPPTSS